MILMVLVLPESETYTEASATPEPPKLSRTAFLTSHHQDELGEHPTTTESERTSRQAVDLSLPTKWVENM